MISDEELVGTNPIPPNPELGLGEVAAGVLLEAGVLLGEEAPVDEGFAITELRFTPCKTVASEM